MNTENYSILTKKFNILISSLHALYRLSSMNLNLDDVIKRLVRLIAQVLNASYCSICIFDEGKKSYLIKAFTQKNGKSNITKKKRIKLKEELTIYKNANFIFRDCYLAIPLITEDLSGVIIVKRPPHGCMPFNATDRQILTTFSEQITIAIRNSQLCEEQDKLILGTIKSLVATFNVRYGHAYIHTEIFPRLALAIATEMGLNEQQMQNVYYASLLHDTGKIDIPLKILAKRTKLTGKEFNLIKTHPVRGVKIIEHLPNLKPTVPIILHHHERFDGKGYPSGLKKMQIPIGARIMAVSDAFEAMVFGRPYKGSLNISDAIEEIKKNSGTQFDPKVVEAFLKIIKRNELIKLIINEKLKLANAHDKKL